MGYESYMLAIGPYYKIPKDILNYPDEWYDDVLPITNIVCQFGHQYTSHSSRMLADVLFENSDDISNFNKHQIKNKINQIPHDDHSYLWPVINQINQCIINDVMVFFIPNG